MPSNAMATKHPKSAQTGEKGVALVRKVAADVRCIFRPFESADIGIDAALELLTKGQEPSGNLVLVQIKAGGSYIRNGRFYIDADKNHFETWSRYSLPVVGIVCNIATEEARWVDISQHLRQHPEVIRRGPYSIEAPASNPFSATGFSKFLNQFGNAAVSATQVSASPNLLIRKWRSSDAKPTRALLSTIAN